MMWKTGLLAAAVLGVICVTAAMADETRSAGRAAGPGGGSPLYRVEIAPSYSSEQGASLKGAAGASLSDDVALGLIVEYGANRRELLANAGIQLSDELSVVGSVGVLEESHAFTPGDGRERVRQMEYGASLRSAHEAGLLSGLELNAYAAAADAGSDSVDAGRLYGIQALGNVDLGDATELRLGLGYEWLKWDGGDADGSLALRAEATHQLSDELSLQGNVKLGASEQVLGGGLQLDLGEDGLNASSLGLSYSHIAGRNGVQDDQRVDLSWTIGFGAGPRRTASADLPDDRTIRPAAGALSVAPGHRLLADVMKRPGFLPQTVIARGGTVQDCATAGITVVGLYSRLPNVFDVLDNPTGPDFVWMEIQSPASPTSVKLEGHPFANSSTSWGLSLEFPGTGTYTLEVDGKTCLLTAHHMT